VIGYEWCESVEQVTGDVEAAVNIDVHAGTVAAGGGYGGGDSGRYQPYGRYWTRQVLPPVMAQSVVYVSVYVSVDDALGKTLDSSAVLHETSLRFKAWFFSAPLTYIIKITDAPLRRRQ